MRLWNRLPPCVILFLGGCALMPEPENPSCCESSPSVCCAGLASGDPAGSSEARRLEVDFLYLDLPQCERCQETEKALEEAVRDLKGVLEPLGTEVAVRKVHVETVEQARRLGFRRSPTVRVMGQDIQQNDKGEVCKNCGCLGNLEVADREGPCRIWTWRGRDYAVPPKALLLEALLRRLPLRS